MPAWWWSFDVNAAKYLGTSVKVLFKKKTKKNYNNTVLTKGYLLVAYRHEGPAHSFWAVGPQEQILQSDFPTKTMHETPIIQCYSSALEVESI